MKKLESKRKRREEGERGKVFVREEQGGKKSEEGREKRAEEQAV